MARIYSVKAASRRWPIHVFYNVLDLALINSWIIYKQVCSSKISRRIFIQKICEELTGHSPTSRHHAALPQVTLQNEAGDKESRDPPPKKIRRTCNSANCRNLTTDLCVSCGKTVCGPCATKKCPSCAE